MGELDARLVPILDAVRRSTLAPLGTSALQRLESAESQRWTVDSEQDPLAPRPDETADERARRQLKILDAVIGGRLRLELDLMEANLSLSRQIANGMDGGGPEAFATVMLVTEADAEAPAGGLVGENLMTGARREQIVRLLDAWTRVVDTSGDGLGSRMEGQDGD